MLGKQKRILLFDDDYESLADLKQYLEASLGFHVELTAEKQLLERLQNERFDLICVDLMIHPTSLDANDQEVQNVHFEQVNWRRTGLELLRRLRQGEFSQEPDLGTSPQVPVLVLSAVANYSVEHELKGDDLVEYVEKPFALEEVIERIRRLLQG